MKGGRSFELIIVDSRKGMALLLLLQAFIEYGPEVESRWGRDFLHPSRQALELTQPPIQRVPGLFPGSKAAGAWC
jgi:hypothetical protein